MVELEYSEKKKGRLKALSANVFVHHCGKCGYSASRLNDIAMYSKDTEAFTPGFSKHNTIDCTFTLEINWQ